MGDEIFDSLILTNFNPNNDCTRSGMDYSLSFKKIYRNDITTTEVTIQKVPIKLENTDSFSLNTGSLQKQINSLQKGITQQDLPKIKTDKYMSTWADRPKGVYRSMEHRLSPNSDYNDANYPPYMQVNR